jgi:FAD/FMN-containing dehydrogenase
VKSERNWARNIAYSARCLHRPASGGELARIIAGSDKIRALGSRHSFNSIADTPGELIDITGLPRIFDLDSAARTVTVNAGIRYGELARLLDRRGWALQNMASLPHITVGGSIATGTHGSGDGNPSLAAAVAAVEFVRADGESQRLARGEAGFDGAVVNLGALGLMTAVTLDLVPAFTLRQAVYPGIGWDTVLRRFDELMSAAYSVSLFTTWLGEQFGMVWLKSTQTAVPSTLGGARRLAENIGLAGGPAGNTTDQGGRPGRWLDRLPHFRHDFTPSNGDELQSEYLVPRQYGVEAMMQIRELAAEVAPLVRVSEIRTIAADSLWLSPAFQTPVVGMHFTWRNRPDEVATLLPRLEERLLPLRARPHWGKLFAARDLAPLYPEIDSFRTLAAQMDPHGKLRNDYLDQLVFR